MYSFIKIYFKECFCTPCLCPAAPYMLRTKLRTHYKIEVNLVLFYNVNRPARQSGRLNRF